MPLIFIKHISPPHLTRAARRLLNHVSNKWKQTPKGHLYAQNFVVPTLEPAFSSKQNQQVALRANAPIQCNPDIVTLLAFFFLCKTMPTTCSCVQCALEPVTAPAAFSVSMSMMSPLGVTGWNNHSLVFFAKIFLFANSSSRHLKIFNFVGV